MAAEGDPVAFVSMCARVLSKRQPAEEVEHFPACRGCTPWWVCSDCAPMNPARPIRGNTRNVHENLWHYLVRSRRHHGSGHDLARRALLLVTRDHLSGTTWRTGRCFSAAATPCGRHRESEPLERAATRRIRRVGAGRSASWVHIWHAYL